MKTHLTIGQIDYLNILPLFLALKDHIPPSDEIQYVKGHPSLMNSAMATGDMDLAPASAFEYLLHAEQYRVLPNLSITAPQGRVKSVFLMSPVPLAELPQWIKENGPTVNLTKASASSAALLKVLWKFSWKLPEAEWNPIEPGTGHTLGRPFLEIGNLALRHWIRPPEGWHIIDLGQEWRDFTGLPFVFSVWIVRHGLSEAQQNLLHVVDEALEKSKLTYNSYVSHIAEMDEFHSWITEEQIEDYLSTLDYRLGPNEQASLILFADYCRKLGLIPGSPALRWAL